MIAHLFSSEAVADGHPDKICDQVADTILDLYLSKCSAARVACEAMATKGHLFIAGEVSGVEVDSDEIETAVRSCLREIGCHGSGFHWSKVDIRQFLHTQASELAYEAEVGKAGDQGIMFGYASDETPDLMPAPIYYSQKIMTRLREVRRQGCLPEILADGKCQVTVNYGVSNDLQLPRSIPDIVLSLQHKPGLQAAEIKDLVLPYLEEVLPSELYGRHTALHINGAGNFVAGGPTVDTGLTGRKIVVDTYGGWVPNGGGSFSGKDGTKVDRSGAYIARYIAKNIVAAKLARRCTVQLAYGIAIAEPVSLYIDTHGTGKMSDRQLCSRVRQLVRLDPQGVMDHLQLARPFYRHTAWGGHFGHQPQPNGAFSWEKLDLSARL